jgi:hypothetical protein
MMGSLDGRRFRATSRSAGAEVDSGTIFEYHQDGNLVWPDMPVGPSGRIPTIPASRATRSA